VLTSTMRLAALTEARDDTSPFLHGFTPPIYLRGLATPAALALIHQEKLPLDQRPGFELEQAEKIRARCDDHPYLLQLVCKRTVELGDVDEALAQVAADPMVSYFFAVDFEMLAPGERRVVELLAASSAAHSGSIAERIAVEGSEINAALRRLESLGYLRRESDGRFVLANFFFRRWLEARRSATTATDQPTLSLPRGRLGADSSKDLASGGKLGKYELRESIGQGGFAVVYKARDPDLDRTVAVKACIEVDEAARARFAREARIVAKLVHPNIVIVHDFGFHGDIAFLVQEYLDGEDLREVIRRGPLPCSVAVPFLIQIAGAMDHAHRHGIVHRDLKPGNVMILRSGEAKVLDFGLAKAGGDETLTADGMALGTVAYLSPEMLGQQPVDARSDVFAFGVLGYELLGGRRPFVGDSLSAVMFAILNTRPVPLRELVPECPSLLEGLLMSCLEKEPGHRPAGFGPILDALTEVQRATGNPSATAASAGS
jgi:tRNA A-37 threonylcarbamoyl transferase component Bud32